MRVLIVGSGAREHAIAWKISQSSQVSKIFVAPGNAGTALEFENVPISATDLVSLADFAEAQAIDLTVVGPEAPLVAGIHEEFSKRKMSLVGPSRQAALLEGSKVFAKDFMARHSIPTARYQTVHTYSDAMARLEKWWQFPMVVKADGLAAGKGVFICSSRKEAENALDLIFNQHHFGDAGNRVVLEEFLEGRETSYMVFTDGRTAAPIVASQDYKRALDNDRGPNTGGMGAVSVPGLISDETERRILNEIIQPALLAMEEEGHPFQGILYAGLMITAEGPKVLEFNVRLGDPETQVVLLRLESDLAALLAAVANGSLAETSVRWSSRCAACVVLAAHGYPGTVQTGKVITGLEMSREMHNIKVFHAGTSPQDGKIITAGGRVLTVASAAGSLGEAILQVYQAVNALHFDGMHYRSDIGAGIK
ncbi:MAG TPA: phosphoribosylamine--glycine ligase [Acidobacteriota bacterium]|nr:phosphoribosylamine--glycine ligase [Acidobacteriota bacterium]